MSLDKSCTLCTYMVKYLYLHGHQKHQKEKLFYLKIKDLRYGHLPYTISSLNSKILLPHMCETANSRI